MMSRFRLLAAVLVLTLGAIPAPAGGLRVMNTTELVLNSLLIARVHVKDTDKSKWSSFKQVAELELVDIIEGDTTLKKVQVGVKSLIANADDDLDEKQDVLVFLYLEGGFYRILNYQYGRFLIEGDTVIGWRNAENVAVNAPYSAVRAEILSISDNLRSHGGEVLAKDKASAQPLPSRTASDPQQKPSRPPGTPPRIVRPERP